MSASDVRDPYAAPDPDGPRAVPYDPAPLATRYAARAVDWGLFLGIAGVSVLVPTVAESPEPLGLRSVSPAVMMGVQYALLGVVAAIGFGQQWLLSRRDQTFGKWVFGIRLVRRSGASPDAVRGVFLREGFLTLWCLLPAVCLGACFGLRLLPAFVGGCVLLAALPLFGQGTLLHDVVSDTTVARRARAVGSRPSSGKG